MTCNTSFADDHSSIGRRAERLSHEKVQTIGPEHGPLAIPRFQIFEAMSWAQGLDKKLVKELLCRR